LIFNEQQASDTGYLIVTDKPSNKKDLARLSSSYKLGKTFSINLGHGEGVTIQEVDISP
jgi:hypothetical protein